MNFNVTPTNATLPAHLYSEIDATVKTALELGLTESEYENILTVLGRKPTYTELGVYSVMWSEHCSYKNSILQLKTLPRSGGRLLVEAGEENAGLVDIGGGYAICFKIESHNHPSAVEPFEGAATGVGGILRDIFTMGARPIAALNSLRFGELKTSRTAYLLKGVVRGIGHYGNCFGVPTVGGEVYFDSCYTDNPLVNAMAVGIVKTDATASAIAKGAGNPVMILGSSTGRDGIHGASLLASREFDEKTEDMRPTVQVGDPFSEKLLLEAALELIASGCIVGMQDMGAAGICCSTSEMSAKGKSGMYIDLDLVPLREKDMSAYEIMLSESQERMLAVVEIEKERIAQDICAKWDVPITKIGHVTDDGIIRVFYHGKQVIETPAESLVLGGGAPVYIREASEPRYLAHTRTADLSQWNTTGAENEQLFWRLLASPTIASKRWIYEQYDSQVRTNTVSISGDAAIMRIKELPGHGFAVSVDCNSRFAYLDPYHGGMMAVAEAARNVVCTGAEPVAITNCLNFGNPYDSEVYYQFKEAVRGIGDMCKALNTPVTGGNVSFHNESQRHAVFPTPTIGMLGLIDDLSLTCSSGFQNEGDLIFLLGKQRAELGGSEFIKLAAGEITGAAPTFEIQEEVKLQKATLHGIRRGLIRSAHDCAEGGLAICLAEKAINSPKGLGAHIDFDFTLDSANIFGEAQSRIVVTATTDKAEILHSVCAAHGINCTEIGKVQKDNFTIEGIVSTTVETLKAEYYGSLPKIMAPKYL